MASKLPKNKAPYMPRAGKTTNGVEYITTHICPACQAEMTSVGSGYPEFVCCRCTIPMVAKSKKVGN